MDMPCASAVYNETNVTSSVAQVPTTTCSVAARARCSQRMAASGNRCRHTRRTRRWPTQHSLVHAHRRPGAAEARAEHGRKVEHEVDRCVVELFIHLLDEAHGPHKQRRRGR
eukprot:3633439-Pleurochrysis_carterae.AAC.1